ncbi:MAG: cytochrome c peroxidase [Pseudomonadota bacterium]|nr:cytochrome c peroxidase [Pseudomonadota bacterium]
MKKRLLGVGSLALALTIWAGASLAAEGDLAEVLVSGSVRDEAHAKGLGPLHEVSVPRPSNLDTFVKNEEMAIVLGKALFWDMQVGSDSQACASCHFHAGADPRAKNQLSPGLLRVASDRAPDPHHDFGDESGKTGSGAVAGPNHTLVEADFPFHRLEDQEDRESCSDGEDDDLDSFVDSDDPDCFDMNDAASSQGTFDGGFVSVTKAHTNDLEDDQCGDADGAIFSVDGVAVRKVEPRHTPTVINAVFNHRNFWDGRASNIFNGLNPLGERGLLATADNDNPGTLVLNDDGTISKVQVRIDNASLASQAVGPPLSDFEMSCLHRTNADLGRKLRTRTPLGFQQVHRDDSVLGPWRKTKGTGLKTTYQSLIQAAFEDKWWAGEGKFDANGEPLNGKRGYTQMEVNFPLFFGLAIQLYEATLVSDQTPFDAYMAGDDDALDHVEQFGLETFLDAGKCVNCHSGAELTGASVRLRANQPDGNEEAIERMVMGDGGVALYDGGFYNIGVRPTFEDLGVGAELAGFPLSFARQVASDPPRVIDDFDFDTDKFEVPGPIVPGERVAVDGAFKVASLRNVELTGPYFHNGGQSTLAQVVEFYDRGGDRFSTGACDTTAFGEECSNLDPDIQRLGLEDITREIDGETVTAETALVRFLLALTDERVRYERAPFDHPELRVPNGQPGDQFEVTDAGDGRATDAFLSVPAVGEDGRQAPLEPFLGLDPTED